MVEEIVLVRHGESEANTGITTPQKCGDFRIALTEKGRAQAIALGESWQQASGNFADDALLYCSPFLRTRQTLQHMCTGAQVSPATLTIREDPRLREIELGFADYAQQLERRREFGWFYYRADQGGENVADVYDRLSMFLDSMWREVRRSQPKKIIIICHGMVIRAFVMRFFHLTVEEFDQMINPHNCDVLRILPRQQISNPLYSSTRWAMGHDLELRDRVAGAWDWSALE